MTVAFLKEKKPFNTYIYTYSFSGADVGEGFEVGSKRGAFAYVEVAGNASATNKISLEASTDNVTWLPYYDAQGNTFEIKTSQIRELSTGVLYLRPKAAGAFNGYLRIVIVG